MCNGMVFQCFGVFWGIFQVFLGCFIRDVLYKLGQRCGMRQIFKFRANSTICNSDILLSPLPVKPKGTLGLHSVCLSVRPSVHAPPRPGGSVVSVSDS